MSIPASLMCAVALALPCAGVASGAQLYKWVDERGVTHYSNVAPAGAGVRPAPIDDRLSVYTPDPQLAQAIEAERARAIEDLRTGRRQRELQQDWLARQYLNAAIAAGSVRCDECDGHAVQTYVPVGLASRRHPPRILPQAQLTPGVTAGNVTAGAGYIPGYSAFAPRTTPVPPRAVLEAPRAGGGRRH